MCTFDRAGMGYSEPGPLPRDAEQFASELHTLLHVANIAAPYVLVGHSMGGLPVCVFVGEYPAEVAGVVLIESMNPKQAKNAVDMSQPRVTLPASSLSMLTLPARIGLIRLLAEPLGIDPPLPSEVRHAYSARTVVPRSMQTTIDESAGMPAGFAQAGAVSSFGDLPLIVLSHGLDADPQWQAMQADLLGLSTKGEQLFAGRSGHNIELDQPEAAIEAIDRMIATVRGGAGL